MIHLEVAVVAPLEQTLTYSLLEGNEGDARGLDKGGDLQDYVGRRVMVGLGRRKVTGYVLQVVEAEEKPYKVKAISKFLDDYPLFHNNSVSFYRWVADYYHYPIGLVLKAALPGGLAPKSVKYLALSIAPEEFLALFPGSHDDISPWILDLSSRGQLNPKETAAILSDSKERQLVNSLVKQEAVSIAGALASDGVHEKREICYSLDSSSKLVPGEIDLRRENIKDYQKKVSEQTGIDLKVSEVKALYALHRLGEKNNRTNIALKDLRKDYSGAAKALVSLEEKSIVHRSSERIFRSPLGSQFKYYPRPEQLTAEQQAVLDSIVPAIQAQQFNPYLLHGVTGCGKTEVYLRAAEETLAAGRDVIILVPEIALATQLEAHLLSRFGDLVVLLHSGMTPSEKYDQFYLALSGSAKIVIGARSALFAPLRNPGLIVVDEEHDSSFKQDDSFRYHGRDMAVLRARHHDAVVILGSATPSVTSYAHAGAGKYTLLTMKERVGESTLPTVTLVDLNTKQAKDHKGIIKKQLYEKLAQNLLDKKQSILLLNRRGFSAVVLCRDCGSPVQCSHCHVSLTLHKGRNQLVCHYCGFTKVHKGACLECRSEDLVPAGFGTERVEEEVVELFPEARVKRLDSDTAADRRKFLAILSQMHDGEIDILIGTQMIAKGHHFPNVTLVGVVWADGGMSMPDFRAAERTFQLVTQVIGRAGRGEQPGEVIIQTLRPDHYALVYSRDHQYKKMFDHEMKLRRHPAFPPYLRLTGLRFQGRVAEEVQQSAVKVARYCRQVVKSENFGIETLGPAPSPLDKIKDNYRWQILLKGKKINELHALCTILSEKKNELLGRNCSMAIDVDPENMM